MRKWSEKELAAYNGKNGRLGFESCNGKVHDVSSTFLRKYGIHQVLHYAEVDLTEALNKAPYGSEVLERFPVVGTINAY